MDRQSPDRLHPGQHQGDTWPDSGPPSHCQRIPQAMPPRSATAMLEPFAPHASDADAETQTTYNSHIRLGFIVSRARWPHWRTAASRHPIIARREVRARRSRTLDADR